MGPTRRLPICIYTHIYIYIYLYKCLHACSFSDKRGQHTVETFVSKGSAPGRATEHPSLLRTLAKHGVFGSCKRKLLPACKTNGCRHPKNAKTRGKDTAKGWCPVSRRSAKGGRKTKGGSPRHCQGGRATKSQRRERRQLLLKHWKGPKSRHDQGLVSGQREACMGADNQKAGKRQPVLRDGGHTIQTCKKPKAQTQPRAGIRSTWRVHEAGCLWGCIYIY